MFGGYIYLFHYGDGKISIDTKKYYTNKKGLVTFNFNPIKDNINNIIEIINKR